MRDVKQRHQPVECTIASDVDDIGDKPSLSPTHLVTCPTVDAAIQIDGNERKDPGEQHYDCAKGQTVSQIDLVEIAEYHQQGHCYRWEIERIEQPRDSFGREECVFVGHVSNGEGGVMNFKE